jgi:hypothetical protein
VLPFLLGWLLVGFVPAVALAQSGAAAPVDQQLQAAIHAYEAGQLDDARALFEQLHAQSPTARTLRGLGVIAFRQGRFVEAISLLEASLSSPLKPLTPELKRAVELVLADARRQVGRVDLVGCAPQARVQIDGAEGTRDAQGRFLIRPGAHMLLITRAGYLERRHEIAIQAGGELSLDATQTPLQEIELPAIPPAVAPSPPLPAGARVASPRERASDAVPWPRRRRLRRASYVLLGIGAAGLITSLGATAAGIKRMRGIEAGCRALPDQQCTLEEAQAKHRAEKLDLLSALSIGGVALGGASATAGLVLWLTVFQAERVPATGGDRGALMLYVRRSF